MFLPCTLLWTKNEQNHLCKSSNKADSRGHFTTKWTRVFFLYRKCIQPPTPASRCVSACSSCTLHSPALNVCCPLFNWLLLKGPPSAFLPPVCVQKLSPTRLLQPCLRVRTFFLIGIVSLNMSKWGDCEWQQLTSLPPETLPLLEGWAERGNCIHPPQSIAHIKCGFFRKCSQGLWQRSRHPFIIRWPSLVQACFSGFTDCRVWVFRKLFKKRRSEKSLHKMEC